MENSYDLVFVGGGLSSTLVSRFLKLRHPHLKILVLERKTSTGWNPGESTVGVAGLFFIRDLGLSTYCYVNHLPKNGLRYFFVDPEKEFDLKTCSEIGSNILPIFPTFQIDRKRFDADLWRMNRELGVDLRTGVEFLDSELKANGRNHKVRFQEGGEIKEVYTPWLIQSCGRNLEAIPQLNELSPLSFDEELKTASAWGRYTKVKDIDSLGDKEWMKRVGFTSRYLSTNHFMGEGYWIWVIPIGEDVVSFGVVYDTDVLQENLQSQESFENFMNSHPFCKLLLEGSETLDFQAAPRLAYGRDKFCDPDGWALLAESFAFVDPFYSPGSDVIARQAYLLEHLVTSEKDRLPEVCDLVNQYLLHERKVIGLLYKGQYEGFGSFDVFNIKSLWDFHSYTNRMVWNFLKEKFADLEFLERETGASERTVELTRSIQNGFRDYMKWLKEKGAYSSENTGNYSLRQNRFRIEEDMLLDFKEDDSITEHLHLCRYSICELLQARFGLKNLDRKIIQEELNFAVLTSFQLTPEWKDKFLKKVARKLTRQVKLQTGKLYSLQVNDFNLTEDTIPYVNEMDQVSRDLLERLWKEPGYNRVAEELVAGGKVLRFA